MAAEILLSLARVIGSTPSTFKGKAKKSALLLFGISVVHSLDREWLGENYVQSTPTHKLGPLRTMQAMVSPISSANGTASVAAGES